MPRRNETSEALRWRIVGLHEAGKGYKVISKSLHVHHSTVRKIIYKWRRHQTVATLPRSGRPAKITEKIPRRNPTETDRVSPEPTDSRGAHPDRDLRHCNTIPGAGEDIGTYSSDTESSDEESVVDRVSLGTTDDREEDPERKKKNKILHSAACDYITTDDDDEDDDDENTDYVKSSLRPSEKKPRRETSWSSSDDETTEEDPAEQFSDPNFDEEKKIYAGSSVTVGALLLLLQTFILKHSPSKAATKDLLDLLNFVVPGCVPNSPHVLKKHLTEYNDKTEIHFYCPGCMSYLGVDPGDECEVCRQSLNKKGLLERVYYFLVMPLEIQLRHILANVHSKLGKHFTRDSSISDINTGGEYRRECQEDSITLSFSCDGSPVFDSSRSSVWPILCTINELPYKERCENILLHTLWFGRGKPNVQSFFSPLINELRKLSDSGMCWKDEDGSELHATVSARICVCDPATRATMQNCQHFSQEFGCGFCYHRGDMVPKGGGYTRVYPVQVDGCDLRHMAETVQLAELVTQNGYEQMGVKGPSSLLFLPSFDIIKGFIPDYMHCFCLGVVPQFVDLWFDSLYSSKNFHLTPQRLNELDVALCEIQPPSEIRPTPGRLSDRKHWSAAEWRAFALLYSPVVLRNVLPKVYYKHWMLLTCALHILLSEFASVDELSCAELCLVLFVAKIPTLYGLEHCSYNCHLLTHLTESARDWGLSWANSAFIFEDIHYRLLHMYSGRKSVSPQIFKNFFSCEKIIKKGRAVFRDASAEMKDFFCSMTNCDIITTSSDHIGEHLATLGCGSRRFLTEGEVMALQKSDTLAWCRQHHDSVTEYKRCVYNNMLITASDYSAMLKRNNSVIEASSCFAVVESLVVVQKPCSCDGDSRCSCRDLLLFCKQLQRVHRQPTIHDSQINSDIAKFLVKVKGSSELCAVRCRDVTAKCVAIEHEGQLYVMRMPVIETT